MSEFVESECIVYECKAQGGGRRRTAAIQSINDCFVAILVALKRIVHVFQANGSMRFYLANN